MLFRSVLKSEAAAKKLFRWMSEEREAWLAAIRIDPLLPARLLPRNYLGQKAWRRRLQAIGGKRAASGLGAAQIRTGRWAKSELHFDVAGATLEY